MTLLIKAGMDAGLDVKYYTLYAHLGGGPTAIGPGGDGRVFSLMAFNENVVAEQGDPALKEWVAQFRATHDFDFFGGGQRTIFETLQASIEKAGSVDAQKVAAAMEGMARPDLLGRDTVMRADDHQYIFPYFVTVFSKDVKYDSEKTGLGWKLVNTFEGKDLAQPTTCKMKRPDM
jgi:branched-chain amino acid transport system substrate-binding protein